MPISGEMLERVLEIARCTGYNEGVKAGMLASSGGAYSEGLRDGAAECWDWCGKYLPAKEDGGAIPVEDLRRIFEVEHFGEIFKKYQFSKAKEIVRSYEESVSQVRIGDEVEIAGKKVLVTRIPENDPQRIHYIDASGRTYANNSYYDFKKTGRHFPIEDLLGQMEESAE